MLFVDLYQFDEKITRKAPILRNACQEFYRIICNMTTNVNSGVTEPIAMNDFATNITTTTGRAPFTFIAAACAAFAVAQLMQIVTPLIIGALMDGLSLDEATVGLFLSGEFLVTAITGFAIAPMLGHLPRRRLTIIGAVLFTIGNGASMFTDTLTALIPYRFVAGIGGGILLAATSSIIAGARVPVRLYGQALAVAILIAAIASVIIPYAVISYGYQGAYGTLILCTLVLLPLFVYLPRGGAPATPTQSVRLSGFPIGVMALIGVFLVVASTTTYYAFVERMAGRLGMVPQDIGFLVAILNIGGIVGSLAAAAMGERFGLMIPLFVSIISHAVFMCIATTTSNVLVFTLIVIAEAFVYFFVYAFMFGLIAQVRCHRPLGRRRQRRRDLGGQRGSISRRRGNYKLRLYVNRLVASGHHGRGSSRVRMGGQTDAKHGCSDCMRNRR